MNVKKTWKQCNDQDVITLFNDVLERSKQLYPMFFEGCMPKLYINSSTRNLGSCIVELTKSYSSYELQKDKNSNNIRYKDACILLSSYILHNKEKVRDILCHEFGHFVSPASHHDYLWRIRSNKIGEIWGITNQRLDNSGVIDIGMKELGIQREQYKYMVECPNCHYQWKYKRMCKIVNYPKKYICTKCQENLIRVK